MEVKTKDRDIGDRMREAGDKYKKRPHSDML